MLQEHNTPSKRTQNMPPPTLHLALSGPSSSGKTTLARLLRDILPQNVFILHEDDFYKTDAEIPLNTTHDLADWDCLESINLPALSAALTHIKAHGSPPPDLQSKEDLNSVGEVGVDSGILDGLKRRAQGLGLEGDVRVAIVDGFLLFSEEMTEVRDAFDVKLFLRTDYETAKKRREARSGYVTLEGFWADPPGYVDKIVWPNYVKDHMYMFRDGNVEGEIDDGVIRRLGIDVMPAETQGDLTASLEWAYGKLEGALLQLDK
jgi:nicotinamide/nicotinate riboside kinase